MSLFKRIENIIKSNMNHKEEDINIDMNSYDDIYYSDSKTIPNKEETFLGTRILLKVPIINAIKIERCKPLTANMWEYPASRKDSVTE